MATFAVNINNSGFADAVVPIFHCCYSTYIMQPQDTHRSLNPQSKAEPKKLCTPLPPIKKTTRNRQKKTRNVQSNLLNQNLCQSQRYSLSSPPSSQSQPLPPQPPFPSPLPRPPTPFLFSFALCKLACPFSDCRVPLPRSRCW